MGRLLGALLLPGTQRFLAALPSGPSPPYDIFLIPNASISCAIITQAGKYKPLYFTGFIFAAPASGLLSMLDTHTHTAEWVVY
ncbi:hypothetical protein BDW02DRAFT_176616 [Decorospora gaudefroyi]|uniref:Secreted protein n=1 Tax=Decorospora gaudefroyi TaxID=184978 RepID=A0A6A5K3Q6_9PLEO|nr:hypothetical protein BDW02DRAFT_176616 [Decorospora gaudefroyi]